jgi:hypothetical protein
MASIATLIPIDFWMGDLLHRLIGLPLCTSEFFIAAQRPPSTPLVVTLAKALTPGILQLSWVSYSYMLGLMLQIVPVFAGYN